ncbi:hypothetical protein NP233_g12789 [Leucocoprinus birnbaumii]|uniref:GST N-terminal domain-containing protein n=1 Tax=Leucocoprinus birnbaumii TaxID=56174 RepID=A0AAD5YK39_9AGAR|nr:hypothetical protein NP233_g12789 [Leucocoprinus birnbaumii]
MIIFYDIAAKENKGTWSPNTWKIRYVLNYKKLPYKTVYLEYPDIAPILSSLGIPPSGRTSTGQGIYTCPSIIDDHLDFDSTQNVQMSPQPTFVTDSYNIAEYLEATYPSTPRIFPSGSEALQKAFYDNVSALIGPPWSKTHLSPLILPAIPQNILNPISAEHFIRTRTESFGPLEELDKQAREEQWKKVEDSFKVLDRWMSKNNTQNGGEWVMGDTITFADFAIAGLLNGARVVLGEESEDWQKMMGWCGGKWKRFMDGLKEYSCVDN